MTTTELIKTLRQMQVLGPVSQAWINEAANRLYDLQFELDEARAEVEQLKQALHDARQENSGQAAQIERTRSEPSRLEIASLAMQGMLASGNAILDIPEVAWKFSDALIAHAKNTK